MVDRKSPDPLRQKAVDLRGLHFVNSQISFKVTILKCVIGQQKQSKICSICETQPKFRVHRRGYRNFERTTFVQHENCCGEK